MNNKRLIKILIITQWIAVIAAIVLGLIEERSLPDTLRAYVLEAESRDLSSSEKIAYSLGTSYSPPVKCKLLSLKFQHDT